VKLFLVLGSVAFALVLAGCTSTTDTQTSGTSAPTTTADPTPTPTPTATAATPSYVADDASIYLLGGDGTHAWIAPSRNIACGITSVFYQDSNNHVEWGCEVDSHTWVTPHTKPGDFCYNAEIPCGTGVGAIDAQAPTPSMHGDERFPSEEAMYGNTSAIALATKTLPYGHSVTVGTITCVSLTTGMTCSNSDGGHGFTVSRSVYLSH
jgi:hypothetical protein